MLSEWDSHAKNTSRYSLIQYILVEEKKTIDERFWYSLLREEISFGSLPPSFKDLKIRTFKI